jgi:serine/threonine-protein kinase RsbW
VRSCYGDTYAEDDFYDPEALRALLGSGRLVSKVAIDDSGRVVGHLGTRLVASGDIVAETIGGIVDPEFRGAGLLRRIGGEMFAVYRELGLVGIRLFATGSHSRSQGLIRAAGGVATGCLLGHIPALTEYKEIEDNVASRRIGSIVFYEPLQPMPPLRIFVPPDALERVSSIAAQLELPREFASATTSREPLRGSFFVHQKRAASIARFGALTDTPELSLERILDDPAFDASEICYLDLPLADPRSPAVATLARECGFCFGAYLPGARASETLRLQRVARGCFSPEDTIVGSEQASALYSSILREHSMVDQDFLLARTSSDAC